ncbi:hypothetical protein ACVMB0_005442 [Bradyrhizobium sp. USDA 4451]
MDKQVPLKALPVNVTQTIAERVIRAPQAKSGCGGERV